MPTRLDSVVVDAADPSALAAFWADALGWTVTFEAPDEVAVEAEGAPRWGEGGPPALVFGPVGDPKIGKNRVHLDLGSKDMEDHRGLVGRLLDRGARPADIGQGDVPWVVLADPEGNEFCVLQPRAEYRDGSAVAAVVLDCADPVGLAPFWGDATGWPVLARREGLVGLRHPTAPATWLELLSIAEPKRGKNRLHIDLAPYPADDHAAEVARLERAGARSIDIGQGDVAWVVLADPEGNELCVLSPR